MSDTSAWPDLPLSAWSETCDTLHRWTQIVGKVRLMLAPLVNHWWNVTLYVTSRGLTTSSIPYGTRTFDIVFDFVDHRLLIETNDGSVQAIALRPIPVADFYSEFMDRLRRLGIDVRIWTMPSEIENAEPFERDPRSAVEGSRIGLPSLADPGTSVDPARAGPRADRGDTVRRQDGGPTQRR